MVSSRLVLTDHRASSPAGASLRVGFERPASGERRQSRDALAAAPGARGVVSGDLATIAGATTVADEVNKLGRFDAVIHNAGVGYR